MDIAREFMGDIDHEYDPNASENPDEELLEMDNTLAPPGLRLAEVLMDRHWVFEEVLWISGSSSNLSRQELAEAVADAKGVDESRVDVCFFDEDEVRPWKGIGEGGRAGVNMKDAWEERCELHAACLMRPTRTVTSETRVRGALRTTHKPV